MCFVWISEQTAIISLYNINWLVCITETESVYCAVRTVFMCFMWISEQTAIISLYSINWLVCITETECVYCAVRTESLYVIHVKFSLQTASMTCHSPCLIVLMVPLNFLCANVMCCEEVCSEHGGSRFLYQTSQPVRLSYLTWKLLKVRAKSWAFHDCNVCPNISIKDLKKISQVMARKTGNISMIRAGNFTSVSTASPLYRLKLYSVYWNYCNVYVGFKIVYVISQLNIWDNCATWQFTLFRQAWLWIVLI
jgi:hypothetical protein